MKPTVANATGNSHEILANTNATAQATGGGGSVTVNASDQVTVAHTGHILAMATVTSVGAHRLQASLNGSFRQMQRQILIR